MIGETAVRKFIDGFVDGLALRPLWRLLAKQDIDAAQLQRDSLQYALDDIWMCANSGYSLTDLKAKIAMYCETQPANAAVVRQARSDCPNAVTPTPC